VPKTLERCFGCMLPQHAVVGFSFHSGDDAMSGTPTITAECLRRGDKIFALLSAFYYSKPEIVESFVKSYKELLTSEPPVQPVPKDGFLLFWNWLWQRVFAGYNVLHLDAVLAFMINEQSNPLY